MASWKDIILELPSFVEQENFPVVKAKLKDYFPRKTIKAKNFDALAVYLRDTVKPGGSHWSDIVRILCDYITHYEYAESLRKLTPLEPIIDYKKLYFQQETKLALAQEEIEALRAQVQFLQQQLQSHPPPPTTTSFRDFLLDTYYQASEKDSQVIRNGLRNYDERFFLNTRWLTHAEFISRLIDSSFGVPNSTDAANLYAVSSRYMDAAVLRQMLPYCTAQ